MELPSIVAITEPHPDQIKNPLLRYLLATRPPFLLASVVACLIGLSLSQNHGQTIQTGLAVLSLQAVMLAHAGINVLNDYYDHLNGSDESNVDRIYPFTGGSRFIQNGLLTPLQTLSYGLVLFLCAVVSGGLVSMGNHPVLLGIGAFGLFLGWAYSAPPLRLNSRGLGELCVALGFGLLIPLGAYIAQTRQFSLSALVVGLPYGLLTMNLLIINQFPDQAADASSGKRHWVVRLGAERSCWLYIGVLVIALSLTIGFVASNILPIWALISLVAFTPGLLAALDLISSERRKERLRRAIKYTIGTLLAYGALVSAVLVLNQQK